jgi:hypothetical protein
VLAIVAGGLLTLLILVIAIALEAAILVGGSNASDAGVGAAILVGILFFIASVPLQAKLTVRFMEKWTGFTLATGTTVWILLAAGAAELLTTWLGPLCIAVAALVQWWLMKDRATPRTAPV